MVFCDLVGSTALSTQLDPEDLREIIGAYHRCVAEAVAELDGFVALDELLLNTAAVRAHADAIVDLSEQHNLRYFRLSGEILKGWTMARQGQPAEGTAFDAQERHRRLARSGVVSNPVSVHAGGDLRGA